MPLTSCPACWRTAKSACPARSTTSADRRHDCEYVRRFRQRPGGRPYTGCSTVVVVVVVLASDQCPRVATTTDAKHDLRLLLPLGRRGKGTRKRSKTTAAAKTMEDTTPLVARDGNPTRNYYQSGGGFSSSCNTHTHRVRLKSCGKNRRPDRTATTTIIMIIIIKDHGRKKKNINNKR